MSKRAWPILGAAVALAAASLGLTACGGSDESSIEISDQWARTSATSQTRGAAYMNITGGSEDDRLVGASVSSDVAGEAQIHETVMVEAESDMTDTGMTETGMTETDESSDSMGDESMRGDDDARSRGDRDPGGGDREARARRVPRHADGSRRTARRGLDVRSDAGVRKRGEQVIEVTVKGA
jgi:hypothetical protein